MNDRSALFHKRQFAADIIVICVRWYLRFALSLRDVEELMAERRLPGDHTTIWRWTQTYAAEVHRRLCGQLKLKGSIWHIDETFVRISGRWMYLFRAVTAVAKPWISICRKLVTASPNGQNIHAAR
jgi:transposase-like protein